MQRLVLGLAVAVAAAVSVVAAAEEPPDWAKALRLSVWGGPAAGNVEVSLNGQFLLEVGTEAAGFHEIADLLKPGTNELKVRLKKPDSPRASGGDLRVEILSVTESELLVKSSGSALASIRVPADADPAATCEETAWFRGAPPAQPPADLKSRYWMFVTGPPAKSRVTARINGEVAHDASEGNEFVEVTALVHKGKNIAEFEVRPACFVPKTGRSGMLRFSIGPAVLEEETVKMTDVPGAEIEILPKSAPETSTLKRSFRAW